MTPPGLCPEGAAAGGLTTDRLVLVIGTNRSGTTWLNKLLLAHQEISGVESAETLLFRSLCGLWRTAARWDPLYRAQLPSAQLALYARRFCDELISSAQQMSPHPSARYFVEKTPGTALHLPWVKLVYPDAWYIRIVRDGRDVARSMRRRDYGSRSDLFNIRCWARHEEMAGAYLRDVERVITVCYEQLCENPLREMRRLYAWLGLDLHDGLVRELARRAGTPVARYNGEVAVGAGKWRSDVSRLRLGMMCAGAGDTLASLGYLEDADWKRWRRRPEFWLGIIWRWLVERGLGGRRAAWLFTAGRARPSATSDYGGSIDSWARTERPYMKDPKAVRDAEHRFRHDNRKTLTGGMYDEPKRDH